MFQADLLSGDFIEVAFPEGYQAVFPVQTVDLFHLHSTAGNMSSMRDLFQRGELVGLVLHEHQVVHRGAAQIEGPVRTDSAIAAFRLKPRESYIHFCETSARHSGKGLYPSMLRLMLVELKRRGYHTAYISCLQTNSASIRGISKAGFTYLWSEKALYVLNGHLRIPMKYTQDNDLGTGSPDHLRHGS